MTDFTGSIAETPEVESDRSSQARLNEAAERRMLARDTIWQGNCNAADQLLRRNAAPLRNTNSIEYLIKQLPC
jgi:hypothetical protein